MTRGANGLRGDGHTRPTISVVIPTLNEAERIGALVRGLWSQGFDEIIIVDGGSTDATVATAQGTQGLAGGACVRVLSGPRGRGHQLDYGLRHAIGDVVVILHADTRLPPDARARIEAALSSKS